MSNKDKKSELADFFSALSEEKEVIRKKDQSARQEIKEKIEDPNSEISSLFAQLTSTFEEAKESSVVQQKKVDSISELMTSFVEEGPPKIVTEIKPEVVPESVIELELEPEPVVELEPDPEPVVETISIPEIEEQSIVNNTVETIKKTSPSEVKEQIDPFLELKIEFDRFKTHVQNHISKQGFTGAGGGEVRLEFLDDVQSSTAKVNDKFLKYSSSAGKWVGADASGGGSSEIADLDIDGGTDIGAAIADADLFIVDDGAGGTNRKTAASRIKTYVADVTLTTAAQGNITSLGTLTALTVDNVVINGATIGHGDDTDLMTVADGVLTVAGELDAATLDISGNADIDGTLEADAITVNGTALDEFISDTVGAMVSSNTETGITVTYQDGDNTLDFVVGTLNQDTTGSAATLTTARTIGGVSFDGSANINLPGVNTAGDQNTSGTAAIATTVTITDNESTNENNAIVFTAGGDVDGGNLGLESDGTLTYNPSTGKITATGFVGALTGDVTGDVTGNADTATALATARTIHGVSFDGSANIDLTEVIEDTVGAMVASNTETGITVTYQDSDGTFDFALAAAQTTITSLLATDIKIGEDDQTKIDFETADEIHFYAANAEQVFVSDGVFGPETDSDVDLGTTGVRWKDAFIDTITTTGNVTVGGDFTVSGTTTTVNKVTVNVEDAFVFEGATADAHETTFSVTDPTADRVIVLPDTSGQVQVTPPITLNGTDDSSSNAGDHLVQDTSADANDRILYEDATTDPIAVLASHGITLSGMGWNAFQFDNG